MFTSSESMLRMINAVEVECNRQYVGPDRVVMLLRAIANARKCVFMTLPQLLEIANTLEPSNNGKIRTTPVTFASGGTAADASVIEPALNHLMEFVNELDNVDDVDRWIKSFLDIHPLSDGNGRTAWVLRTWMLGQWDDPQPLPDYFG